MKTSFSSIECLEARIAPAGLIAVSVSNAGTLMLKTIAGQDGDEVVTITETSGQEYLLTPGAGVTLRIDGQDFTTAQTVRGVFGGLVAKLGVGNDQVVIDSATISKAVAIDLGDGNNALTIQNCALGGKLNYTGLGGVDTITFGTGSVSVGGAVKLRLGAGSDVVNVSTTNRAAFGAGLTIDAGLGDDAVTLGGTNGTVDVMGAFQYLGGSGLNTLTAGAGTGRVSVLGAATITGGIDNDTITLGGARFTAGSLAMNLGAGDNTLTSTATDFFIGGSMKWSGGAGLDRIDVTGTAVQIAGSVTVLNGDGASFTHIKPTAFTSIGGALTVLGGKAATGLFDFRFDSSVTNINGLVKVKNGDGENAFRLAGGSSLHLGKGASVSHGVGAGNATISGDVALVSNGPISIVDGGDTGLLSVFGGSGGDNVINGAVTIKGGNSPQITMSGTITGAVNLTAAPGASGTMQITSNGGRPLHVGGAINMTASGGAANTETFTLGNVVAEGAVTARGGSATSNFRVDNSIFLKAVKVDLGAGSDTFNIEQQGIGGSSIFAGPVTFLGGLDADTFLLGGNSAVTQGIDFRALVILDGGDGADVLTLGTQAVFVAGSPVQKNIP